MRWPPPPIVCSGAPSARTDLEIGEADALEADGALGGALAALNNYRHRLWPQAIGQVSSQADNSLTGATNFLCVPQWEST